MRGRAWQFIFVVRPDHARLGLGLIWLLSRPRCLGAILLRLHDREPGLGHHGMRAMRSRCAPGTAAPAYFVLGAVHAVVLLDQRQRAHAVHRPVGSSTAPAPPARHADWHSPHYNTNGRLRWRARDVAHPELALTQAGCRADARRICRISLPAVMQRINASDPAPRDTPQFYLTAPRPAPTLPAKRSEESFTHLVGGARPELKYIPPRAGFRRQSIHRLPAGLRGLPRLFLGPRRRQRLPPTPKHAPSLRRANADIRVNAGSRGCGARSFIGPRRGRTRTYIDVPRLSRFPASRRRHGRHTCSITP